MNKNADLADLADLRGLKKGVKQRMLINEELTQTVIGCFYKVYNTLGYGFLEHVYENALFYELSKNDLEVKKQCPITVHYEDIIVGKYFADIVVDNKVIIELKAVSELNTAHESQLMNYLKATNITVGLLLNFGREAEFRRMVNTKRAINPR